MDRLLINCDLGENETEEKTKCLLELVDAANICCGVHAGGREKTRVTIELAQELGVLIGAHPGLEADGGRGETLPSPSYFRDLLDQQLDSFQSMADQMGANLSYVKLHGSLYHAVERNSEMADIYLGKIIEIGEQLGVFALAGGVVASRFESQGVRVWREGFLDRGYLPNGSLVPRGQARDMLDVEEAVKRYADLSNFGCTNDIQGQHLGLTVNTLCVHGDAPESETLLARIRDLHSL